MVSVQIGERLRDLWSQDPQQWKLGHLDDGHFGVLAAGGSGNLEPDPAGTDARRRPSPNVARIESASPCDVGTARCPRSRRER